MVRGALDGAAVVVHHPHTLRGEDGNVAVREEKRFARMLEQGRNIAGDEIFSLAKANHRRRAQARGDNLLGIIRRKENQCVDAAQFLQRPAYRFFKRNAALRVFFHEVRHNFSVRFGGELVSFLLQLFLEFEVVFDNSVVDDDDLARAVAMRMGVFFCWTAVGGPARVADAISAIQWALGDDLFEIAEFSRGTADFQLAGVGNDGDARGIVTTVLELAQSLDDDGHNFLWPDITDYSAHARDLLRRFLAAYHAGSLTKVNSGKPVTNQITVNMNSLRHSEIVS